MPSGSTTSSPVHARWSRSRSTAARARCPTNCSTSATTSCATSASAPTARCGATPSFHSRSNFFHPGKYFDRPIRVHEVDGNKVREIVFDPANFNYGKNTLDIAKLRKVGFAGFRVHFPLNTPQYKDEVLVFQGASYFRALGRTSATVCRRAASRSTPCSRGARSFRASRSSGSSSRRPMRKRSSSTRCSNSQRVTGAYRFLVTPGVDTVVEVQSRLFLRPGAEKSGMRLGIAPLTSMFYFGENQRSKTRGLPARGARLGRPVGRHGGRRMDLAAPRQPEPHRLELVLATDAARLRPAAARPRLLSTTRISRRTTRSARAPGSNRWAPGATAASSWR